MRSKRNKKHRQWKLQQADAESKEKFKKLRKKFEKRLRPQKNRIIKRDSNNALETQDKRLSYLSI